MEAEAAGLGDWEVLHRSEDAGPAVDSGNFVGMESDSDGAIRSNYFSLDGQRKCATRVAEGDRGSEEGLVESHIPSWIDPATSLTRYGRKNSSEFWSDSSSDRSEERKFSEFDATNELNSFESVKNHVGFGVIEEMEAEQEKTEEIRCHENKFSDLDVTKESNFVDNDNSKGQMGFQDFGKSQTRHNIAEKCISKSGYGNVVKIPHTSEFSSELNDEIYSTELIGEEGHSVESESVEPDAESKSDSRSGGEEKRRIVWWKVPFEVLKYCVYGVGPVWSFSMAAAFMGFIILGRRLYKMRRKSQSLKLKFTVDDKKESQFIGRAARLNEAFSVVRRVPIVRPSLPASGVIPWPVMSMR